MSANFWGARAPRPHFSAPRRKACQRYRGIQRALREAHNAAREARALPKAAAILA
jgi:hypothetical protein